jgi:hypothetical protein
MSSKFFTRGAAAVSGGGAAGRSTFGGVRRSSPALAPPRQAVSSNIATKVTGAGLPISDRLKQLHYQARRRDTTRSNPLNPYTIASGNLAR